ncbi:MAG TPA: hypothetical protein VID47_00690 [Actinomycetota bacterium]|jgi:UPF0716 family protein affecting phage T7 exclusion
MVWLVLLLLLAAALGVLGAVIKVALVLALGFVFAVVLLGVIGYYYVRHRFRRMVKEQQQQRAPGEVPGPPRQDRGYPTTGTKGPGPSLPE